MVRWSGDRHDYPAQDPAPRSSPNRRSPTDGMTGRCCEESHSSRPTSESLPTRAGYSSASRNTATPTTRSTQSTGSVTSTALPGSYGRPHDTNDQRSETMPPWPPRPPIPSSTATSHAPWKAGTSKALKTAGSSPVSPVSPLNPPRATEPGSSTMRATLRRCRGVRAICVGHVTPWDSRTASRATLLAVRDELRKGGSVTRQRFLRARPSGRGSPAG